MLPRVLLQSIFGLMIFGALLFLPAGTLAWPGGWVYLVEIIVASIAMTQWLSRHNPALLAERTAPLIQREQETWDKVLMSTFLLLWCVWFVVMGLDAMRYGWSVMPLWIQVLGALAIAVSMYIIFLTMRANTFAAPVVKIQATRGHRVVSEGPYAVVRHPMYGGAVMLIVATPLLLGSWWGLAMSPILVLLLAIRAVMEERTLTRELEGYADYARRVRYRFVPRIW
jgi:protein-S-isoprenylcysteine O-methyltransferase Ste14